MGTGNQEGGRIEQKMNVVKETYLKCKSLVEEKAVTDSVFHSSNNDEKTGKDEGELILLLLEQVTWDFQHIPSHFYTSNAGNGETKNSGGQSSGAFQWVHSPLIKVCCFPLFAL